MKILYLAAIRLPTEKAHGLQIMKTCEALSREGAEVELVIPSRKNPLREDPFAYYGVEKNFTLTELAVPDLVGKGKWGFLATALWFSEKAKWLHRFWHADVIYSRDAIVLLQYLLLGVSFVYEAHTAPTLVSRIVARHARRVVTISRGLADAYRVSGVSSGKIIIAPDGVDLSSFEHAASKLEARKKLGIAHDANIALYVGRIDAEKGVEMLAQAAAQLAPDIQAVIIGAGPMKEVLMKKYPAAAFLPETPYRELPNILPAADILVIPNSAKSADTSLYTSPLKLFAYMASGLPIAASDVPAIREVLDDTSAFFFLHDDAQSLATVVKEALRSPEEGRSRAEEARRRAHRLTWRNRADIMLSSL